MVHTVVPRDLKSYQTYSKQLELLQSRYMLVEDKNDAIKSLKDIGYYRFSAYSYPFRIPYFDLLTQERFLHNDFYEGTQFSNIVAIYDFDKKMRRILLDEIAQLEVAFGVSLAYTLGRKDPEAHLLKEHMNLTYCDKRKPKRDEGEIVYVNGLMQYEETTYFENWIERFNTLKKKANNEKFVAHHKKKYGGKLPIWVAIEFMDFGALLRLFALLNQSDKLYIIRAMGLDNLNARQFQSVFTTLSTIRNHCAHNNRVWNRDFNSPTMTRLDVGTSVELDHLVNANTESLYYIASVLAFVAIRQNPKTNFPRSFATQVKKFPSQGRIDISAMGFPSNWLSEKIWSYSFDQVRN